MERQTKTQTTPAERRVVILVHSAIAGASIAAALELASRETLTPLLLLAVGCFAIAIPTATTLVIFYQVIYELGKDANLEERIETGKWSVLGYVLAVIDQITCYLGFLAIFWHFHWGIGITFFTATLLAFLAAWMAEANIRKARNETLSPPVEQ